MLGETFAQISLTLRQLGGIAHHYTVPGTGDSRDIRLVEWHGLDPSDTTKHIWFTDDRQPVPLGASFLDGLTARAVLRDIS